MTKETYIMAETDISFLCHVLKKSHIGYAITPLDELVSRLESNRSSSYLDLSYTDSLEIIGFLVDALPKTLYRITDTYKRKYLLLFPFDSNDVMMIGPYLSFPVSEDHIDEIFKLSNVIKRDKGAISEYFWGLPLIEPSSPFSFFLTSFFERMWKMDTVTVVDILCHNKSSESAYNASLKSNEASDVLLNMKAMEMRYTFENDMIRAISLGQLYMEEKIFSSVNNSFLESRAKDPLRNAKNYGIIMNTLLRKAAERGGVHPIHIDKASSDFALKLERSSSVEDIVAMMGEMFRYYCRLVRKHRLSGYSLTVQKIILSIDRDLADDLSTGALAKRHGISAGYLSSIFKKETGKTVSEYIRGRRMEYARYLLANTALQVQTVAFNSGIEDVQYFSKIFKREFGQTPSEYRSSVLDGK
jgi:AraC-like DNA-binding protein